MEPTTIQTRIPAFLWDSLQDVFYQHDHEFLRQLSFLLRVPLPELKRTLVGARGAATHVVVAKQDAWWEGQTCPLRCRTDYGLWRGCGNLREVHGVCGTHKGWRASATLKHRDDPYFQGLVKRKPFHWESESRTIWVSEQGDAVDELGQPIPSIRVFLDIGMVVEKSMIPDSDNDTNKDDDKFYESNIE